MASAARPRPPPRGGSLLVVAPLAPRYTRTNCPRYLRPEHFEALRARVDRVSVHTGLLHEVAAQFPDGYFSCMVLLDHMDWMSAEQITQEWAVFSRKLHDTRGRVLWRSFAHEQAEPRPSPSPSRHAVLRCLPTPSGGSSST